MDQKSQNVSKYRMLPSRLRSRGLVLFPQCCVGSKQTNRLD